MYWQLSNRSAPQARAIADRHYNRQSIGAVGFVPPGRCLVLVTEDYGALWVTSFPFAQYVKHQWAGAWVCSAFRRESGPLASDLIRDALAATRWKWGDNPLGMITFIDRSKVIHKRDPGRCYRKAGFREVGETKGGLLALHIATEDMPPAAPPFGVTELLAI